MSGSFAKFASEYLKRGLSVVPVELGTKRPPPGIRGWTGYLSSPANDETIAHWLDKYPTSGIALLTGAEVLRDWVLIAIDVDDDRLAPAAKALLCNHKVVVGKRGKRGATLFVLVPKIPKVRSMSFKGVDGLGNIDILASGKMTLMPPTVHPETQRPYEDYGQSLIETPFEQIPRSDGATLELLRLIVGAPEAAQLLSGHFTHNPGHVLTAKLVTAGAADELIDAVVRSLLPPGYSGDSLEQLPEWIASARAKGFERRTKKPEHGLAAIILSLALEHIQDLFHDQDRIAYASVPSAEGALTYQVSSSGFRSWLQNLVFKQLERAAPRTSLTEVLDTLEAKARFDGEQRQIARRVAANDQSIEVDLGRLDGLVVSITKHGWTAEQAPSQHFVRGAGFGKLPEPIRTDDALQRLKELLHLDENSFLLMLAFLINALRPAGPYFILLVEGEHGSGKSFFCKVLKAIIDPNVASSLRLPDNDRDLMIHAKEYWLLCYDNASGIKGDISDALCSLATGGGIAVRKLYTDGELHVMSFSRPVGINGISGYAQRPDLIDRSLPIKLPPIPPYGHRTEAELLAGFNAILPGVLAELYDAVSSALANLGKEEPPRHLRMADAVAFIDAAEPALDVKQGSMVKAIEQAQRTFAVDRVNDDQLVVRLREILDKQDGHFEGGMAALFKRITADNEHSRALPRSPSSLSAQLARLRPSLEMAGISVVLSRDNRGGRVELRDRAHPQAGAAGDGSDGSDSADGQKNSDKQPY